MTEILMIKLKIAGGDGIPGVMGRSGVSEGGEEGYRVEKIDIDK